MVDVDKMEDGNAIRAVLADPRQTRILDAYTSIISHTSISHAYIQ